MQSQTIGTVNQKWESSSTHEPFNFQIQKDKVEIQANFVLDY